MFNATPTVCPECSKPTVVQHALPLGFKRFVVFEDDINELGARQETSPPSPRFLEAVAVASTSP